MKNICLLPPIGIQKSYIYLTQIGDAKYLYDLKGKDKTIQLSGAGTHINKSRALKISEYEALERISNSVNCRPTIVESKKKLNCVTVDMEKFPQISKEESSKNIKFSPNQICSWVECIDLYTLESKLIPANYVYLYNDKHFYGDRVTTPTTTGAALHDNYVSAIINGIYEVVERDSIALTWLLKHIKGNITHLFDDEQSKVFNNSFLGAVQYYDVSSIDGITTICAHARSNFSKNCKNVLMFCSDLNFINIKEKLWGELVSIMYSFYFNNQNYDSSTDYTLFVNVEQGGAFMAKDFNDHHFDFFKDIPIIEKIYPEYSKLSKQDELKELMHILKGEGFSIYVSDISCREVLDRGYKSVKVVIPEAQPISFEYNSRYLDSKRFIEIAQSKYGMNYKTHINKMPLAFS